VIESAVLGAIAAASVPRVVVVDGSRSRSRQVAAVLTEVGCQPIETSTPLEALELIQRPGIHVSGVALAPLYTQTERAELADFLADTHPEIRVALIADDDGDLGQHTREFGKSLKGAA
jgi:hypothetical protein